MRDSYKGERAIKDKGVIYLPPTQGMEIDGMTVKGIGRDAYNAYKLRARYPMYVKRAVQNMVGAMVSKPAKIELPDKLKPLITRATVQNEPLALLLRRVYAEQLLMGRFGLMLDIPKRKQGDPSPIVPYIATYDADTVINWDDGSRENPVLQALNLVVLDESEEERTNDFDWKRVPKYRVLILGSVKENETAAMYKAGFFRETEVFSENELIAPNWFGQTLTEIPFVFINPIDLLPEPSQPPLIELANLSLSIYRQDADYRQNLFMQGQDTLVTIGASKGPNNDYPVWRTGSGASINLGKEGDAKFIGVGADGLGGQRTSLDDDRKEAQNMSGEMLDTTSREKESGQALKTRVAAGTVTLREIAMTGAEGVRQILITAAIWSGMTREQAEAAVIVTPNLEFSEAHLTPAEFVNLADAKTKGVPISEESIHAELVKARLTVKDFKDEKALVDQEKADAQARAVDQATAMAKIIPAAPIGNGGPPRKE